MKYAVVQCVNGNFSIVAEYTDNIQVMNMSEDIKHDQPEEA